jgi:hypothetical protein
VAGGSDSVLRQGGLSGVYPDNGVGTKRGRFRLPTLRSLGELADRAPVIVIDTREQEPLAFRNLSGCSTPDLLSQKRNRDRSHPCHHRRRVLGESP